MKCIFVFSFLLFVPPSLLGQGWEWQNPLPQGNNLQDIEILDQNTAIAVGAVGTVMKTTNAGETWDLQHYAGGTFFGLYEASFADENNVWAVGGTNTHGVVIRSTDGGTSWMEQAFITRMTLSSICFTNSDSGWITGFRGEVYRTTDGGATWTASGAGSPTNHFQSVHFVDSRFGWVVGEKGLVFKSEDGGVTWTEQDNGERQRYLYSVFFVNRTTGWAVGAEGLILHTSDGGIRWDRQPSGTLLPLYSVSFTSENVGWVAGSSGTILYTTDGGDTWLRQTSEIRSSWHSIAFSGTGLGWAVGISGNMIRTTDGGKVWDSQVLDALGFTGTTASMASIDSNRAWAAGYQSLLRTRDGGNTWARDTTDAMLVSIDFVDENRGWAVGANGIVFHTTDGALSWLPQMSGTTNSLTSVCFVDSSNGWSVGTSGTIIRTTDGGTTWVQQMSTVSSTLNSVFFVDADNGWSVGGSGNILRTSDAGLTWAIQASGTSNQLYSVFFADTSLGWTVGSPSIILKTSDGGVTWDRSEREGEGGLYSISFADPNTGWAVGVSPFGSIVLKTTDSGTTWIRLMAGPSDLIEISFTDATRGWIIGGGGDILHTTTGGTGTAPPIPPTPVSPKNGSIGPTEINLVWTPTSPALWYNLQVSTNPYFITTVVNQAGIGSVQYQPPGLIEGATYYWRVSVTNRDGTSGWSEAWRYSTQELPDQPVLVSPANGQLITSDSTTFVWRRSVPLIDRYWFAIAIDSLFSNSSIDSLLTDTLRTWDSLGHNQMYWWRVRAHNDFGWGRFSEVRSFFVFQKVPASPMLISPPDSAFGISTSPILSWNPSLGADSFALQLSDTSDFSRFVVNEDSLTETALEVTGLSNNVTYYWRVNATNDLGTSEWSDVWSFTTLVTTIDEEQQIPAEFSLSQNYPNPFNPSTVIRYELPERSHVRLEVFNPLGQRIAMLVDGDQEAGYHSTVLESRGLARQTAGGLASGLYFYRLQAGSFVGTKKLIVLR